jgi:hypothetical protein
MEGARNLFAEFLICDRARFNLKIPAMVIAQVKANRGLKFLSK